MYNVDYEQRIYNPERMRKYRLDRAHAMLKKHGLGSLIVFSYDTHRYLGYYSTHQYARRRPGTFLLLIRDGGYPYASTENLEDLLPWYKGKFKLRSSGQGSIFGAYPPIPEYIRARWDRTANEVKELLKEHRVLDLPCGIDMTGPYMIKACEDAGINVVDGNMAVAEARTIKNEDEIECCRTAGAITESAHWEVARALRPGITEWQVAGVAAKALFDLGAEEMEGPSFVACSGYRSGNHVPAMPTDRIVRPGELFILDINGISFQGYRTCFYRTYCVGDKPTAKQKEIYQAALEAQLSMEKNIKPGITNHEFTKACMKDGKGKWSPDRELPQPGKYYRGTLSHSLGLCSGDPGPSLSISERSFGIDVFQQPAVTIEKNMVFAVESRCCEWDGKKWGYDGVKIENVVAVTDTGCEVLYRFPYKDLMTVGLPGVY